MNDVTVNINGNIWVVPSNKSMELIAWLNSNAYTTNKPQTTTQENVSDPRTLILE